MLLSDRLKTDTRLLHDEAEAHPAMRALVAPTLARETYRHHLIALLGFHGAVEPALAGCPGLSDWLPDLPARTKTDALREDLRALGLTEDDLDAIGETARLAGAPGAVTDVADGLGVLYVVEGATLGGRILARHLSESLGLDAASGARHFLSYGDERGAMWRRFREALNAFGQAHPDRHARVVGAAQATFAAFTHALPLPDPMLLRAAA